MNKIKRVSLFFRIIFQIVFITLPILLIIAWKTSPGSLVMLQGFISMSFIPDAYTHAILHPLTVQERILGFCLSAIPTSIELYILYSLIKLFKLYEQGEIFSLNNVRYIRNIGIALIVGQLVNPIYQFLMGLVLTLGNPHGHRFAAITLNQTNIGIVLMALFVILISWIMSEGCKLREEQQLTV